MLKYILDYNGSELIAFKLNKLAFFENVYQKM